MPFSGTLTADGLSVVLAGNLIEGYPDGDAPVLTIKPRKARFTLGDGGGIDDNVIRVRETSRVSDIHLTIKQTSPSMGVIQQLLDNDLNSNAGPYSIVVFREGVLIYSSSSVTILEEPEYSESTKVESRTWVMGAVDDQYTDAYTDTGLTLEQTGI